MWQKYVTRRLAVQVAQAWNFGWGNAMEEVYGVSVKDTLVFRDTQKTEYYVDALQHEYYVKGLYNLLEDQNFLQKFHPEAQQTLENILHEIQIKFRQDFTLLSYEELLDIYQNFILPQVEQFYIRMWTVFNIGEPLSQTVQKYLEQTFFDKEKITDYLLRLSSPLVSNDVLKERFDILSLFLIKDSISAEEFERKFEEHTQKYCHIPMFDFDHEPYTYEYFQKEFYKIQDPQKELQEIEYLFKNRQQEFEATLDELKPNQYFLRLLHFLKENVFLRDHRDMIRQKLNLELKKFYSELALRLGLTLEEIATLTNQEIVDCLKNHIQFSKEEVLKRAESYLLIQKGESVEIYSGIEAKAKAAEELQISFTQEDNEIRGTIGSKGFARGTVKVVYTNRDLEKVQNGDVLVATMTRQDFVPAIRRACALVTDEGSITAHAAIIARELNIPCIVAAKIATQVFKDGDIVEVDATSGIVKKI